MMHPVTDKFKLFQCSWEPNNGHKPNDGVRTDEKVQMMQISHVMFIMGAQEDGKTLEAVF